MTQCNNLTTVLFSKNGIGDLEATLHESIRSEQVHKVKSQTPQAIPSGLH